MGKNRQNRQNRQTRHPPHPPQAKLTPEQEIAHLATQIQILKLLPGDFRDIEPHSQEWKQYAEYMPEATEAMKDWLSGPILCFGAQITSWEKSLLESTHSKITYCEIDPAQCTFRSLIDALETAEAQGITQIYFKGFPLGITRGVNWLVSFFKFRVRAKHELTEQKHG